ncbi:hypothetical protein A3K24_03125 [candidate division Kazan bacterium RIFCSPHIGHO2_01_FULL_44_14]|uniref:Transposase IS116/IS110/IS902 C-terminal domain-containing protein n=1 Tax=candidate division Kazan bacterium RIFCSPLOWO2_01_FULL_45_19 TaxID=1798538 RepID=A0A1F4NQP2_UNCK3|nr:hypothetical protein [uncultured bacterium]OGB73793.1 MAG: hypothetical protein A3K51_03125 [candidate division Kazan bacterium RIFCSPLOWO2_01_FULL_45_19]OGB78038.1 MAG: hypothetical protein A3K24_03125 [candidate division Kazan bacterium RIFCSPHIGHO2_01_FULL_44_14]
MSAEGEPRPTQVHFWEEDASWIEMETDSILETEDDELEFVTKVFTDDVIAMVLGGSGDPLGVALARVGAKVLRIPSFLLKEERGTGDKNNDAELLAFLVRTKPDLFYEMLERDISVVKVTALWQISEEAMMTRISCGNRIHQRCVGRILMESGMCLEGKIKDQVKSILANDKIYQALEADENRYLREMTKALEQLDIYVKLFKPLEGVGPKIAARVISAVQDIRRFPTEHAFKSYCGLSVGPEGEFVRHKRGQVGNYSPTARQAFYLLQDQFNRRPKSPWGQKLLENKRKLREIHPEPIQAENKSGKMVRKYSDGHILKMAQWRTTTQFAVWLYREWTKIATTE